MKTSKSLLGSVVLFVSILFIIGCGDWLPVSSDQEGGGITNKAKMGSLTISPIFGESAIIKSLTYERRAEDKQTSIESLFFRFALIYNSDIKKISEVLEYREIKDGYSFDDLEAGTVTLVGEAFSDRNLEKKLYEGEATKIEIIANFKSRVSLMLNEYKSEESYGGLEIFLGLNNNPYFRKVEIKNTGESSGRDTIISIDFAICDKDMGDSFVYKISKDGKRLFTNVNHNANSNGISSKRASTPRGDIPSYYGYLNCTKNNSYLMAVEKNESFNLKVEAWDSLKGELKGGYAEFNTKVDVGELSINKAEENIQNEIYAEEELKIENSITATYEANMIHFVVELSPDWTIGKGLPLYVKDKNNNFFGAEPVKSIGNNIYEYFHATYGMSAGEYYGHMYIKNKKNSDVPLKYISSNFVSIPDTASLDEYFLSNAVDLP